MINFDPLWETLRQRNITQYQLIKDYGISTATIDSFRHNKSVTLHTINTLCNILNCSVSDIIEYIPDN